MAIGRTKIFMPKSAKAGSISPVLIKPPMNAIDSIRVICCLVGLP